MEQFETLADWETVATRMRDINDRLVKVPTDPMSTEMYYIHYKEDVKFLLEYIHKMEARKPLNTLQMIEKLRPGFRAYLVRNGKPTQKFVYTSDAENQTFLWSGTYNTFKLNNTTLSHEWLIFHEDETP